VGDSDGVGDGEVGTAVSVGVGELEDGGDEGVVVDGAVGVVDVLGAIDGGWRVGCLLGAWVGVDVGAGRFGWD
jgi:hypothetical protein